MIGSKPVVCVTSSTNNAVFPEATREIQMTMTYCDAIYSAGGVPVVGPEHGAEELSELISTYGTKDSKEKTPRDQPAKFKSFDDYLNSLLGDSDK